MKTVIIALNSKYIHSSLAPWYLKANSKRVTADIKVLEFTINDDPDRILTSIYNEKADIAAFSCYIWNIDLVLKLSENLKKINPKVKILLGGPEVSFNAQNIMINKPQVDFIMLGEGEKTFGLLLDKFYFNKNDFSDIPGLVYRNLEKVFENLKESLIDELDTIASPYTEEMLQFVNDRIIYFESSRGCPFSCSYCISSTFEGVRYFGLDRVKQDLIKLINSGIRQIKFVDRTFNCNIKRAKEIFKFIINYFIEVCPEKEINFHFEAAADLFDDECLDILAKAPSGLIQFEIGVQTTNLSVHKEINRKTSLDKVFYYVRKIQELNNINLHLDLIAGLPGEDYDSFKKSFDDVYKLKPHQLQLGFLKLLWGSRIREEANIHGYQWKNYPTYEILCNNYISYGEILKLKGIEELVERYYNSGRFVNALEYLINNFFKSPFDFFQQLLEYYVQKGYFGRSFSSRSTYDVLFEFIKAFASLEEQKLINELLKLDYLSSDNSNNLPESVNRHIEKNFSDLCFEFLRNEKNISDYLHEFINMPSKQIYKRVHFEVFTFDVANIDKSRVHINKKNVIIFNYAKRNKVTNLYEYQKVDFTIL